MKSIWFYIGIGLVTLSLFKLIDRPIDNAHDAQATLKDNRARKILQINLSASLVAKMEKNWDHLPKQAAARREERGWRMTRVKPGSLFAEAGLEDGDLITNEFLDKLRTSNEQMELMLRVQQILNRISN